MSPLYTKQVDGANIIARTVPNTAIIADALTAGEIAPDSVGASEVIANTITAAEVATTFINQGTYTPTFTTIANITTNTPSTAWYARVMDRCFVWTQCAITTTAGANTLTQFRCSLPIAFNLVSAASLAGEFASTHGSQLPDPGVILGDTANDTTRCDFNAQTNAAQTMYMFFAYILA